LFLPQHAIVRKALLRARKQTRAPVMVRVFWVVICAIALTGSGCTTRMASQTASKKKDPALNSKSRTLLPLTALVSEPVNSKKVSESKKSVEARSEAPIPLPAAPLLSPQPEANCEVETTGSNANERQKLDYERQCYRHAEMIVRDRLQLLQRSVDATISAVKGSERGSP